MIFWFSGSRGKLLFPFTNPVYQATRKGSWKSQPRHQRQHSGAPSGGSGLCSCPHVPEDFLPTPLPGINAGSAAAPQTLAGLPPAPLPNLHGAELLSMYTSLLVGDFKVVILRSRKKQTTTDKQTCILLLHSFHTHVYLALAMRYPRRKSCVGEYYSIAREWGNTQSVHHSHNGLH